MSARWPPAIRFRAEPAPLPRGLRPLPADVGPELWQGASGLWSLVWTAPRGVYGFDVVHALNDVDPNCKGWISAGEPVSWSFAVWLGFPKELCP